MLRFGETKLTKEKLYTANMPTNMLDVSVDNIVENNNKKNNNNWKKANSKYLVGYLDKAIRPIVLIRPKSVDVLRHLKLKIEIKIKTINWCLSV